MATHTPRIPKSCRRVAMAPNPPRYIKVRNALIQQQSQAFQPPVRGTVSIIVNLDCEVTLNRLRQAPCRFGRREETPAVKGTRAMKTDVQVSRGRGKTVAGVSFRRAAARFGGIMLCLVLSASAVRAADWPCWGGQPSRNMASETEKGLPDWYSLGEKNDSGGIDLSTTKNIKWAAKLGETDFWQPGGEPRQGVHWHGWRLVSRFRVALP